MRSFVDVNNRLALRLFSSLTNPVSKSATAYNNMVMSPFTITSSLGMLFLGARGSTAAQLDGLLNLDDVITFNPHLMYSNISQSFLSVPNTAAALIRLLISDKVSQSRRTNIIYFRC
jgi:serine protease inhibitor